ncbi:MAG: Transcriptional regulator, TetR family [Micavibrio sp.]|nr:Transcriptional regulator, TetR family [Micavibrio sp.]
MAQASKRENILEAAGILFMNQGFQSVSMDQIAAAVPVSKPTLYAHFKDKRELFSAVISARCAVFISSLQAGVEAGKTPEQALYNFARDFLDVTLAKESLQFHRTMVGESVTFPEMAELFYETGPLQVKKVLQNYFDTLNQKKIVLIDDTALAADIFLSMVKGHTHLKCLLGITKDVPAEERDFIARETVRFFIKGYSV